MTFDELNFIPHKNALEGIQARVDFSNGYGASVIKTPYSYGGDKGLYELAVMVKGGICYDTPITNDVEGHLTTADITRLLGEIEALPQREAA